MLKILEIIFFPSIEACEEKSWGVQFQNIEQVKIFQHFSRGSSGKLKSLPWMTSRSHLSNAWLQQGHNRLRQDQCAYVGWVLQLEPAVLSPNQRIPSTVTRTIQLRDEASGCFSRVSQVSGSGWMNTAPWMVWTGVKPQATQETSAQTWQGDTWDSVDHALHWAETTCNADLGECKKWSICPLYLWIRWFYLLHGHIGPYLVPCPSFPTSSAAGSLYEELQGGTLLLGVTPQAAAWDPLTATTQRSASTHHLLLAKTTWLCWSVDWNLSNVLVWC
jgi:hypothetical protein